jgi:peptide deformylase
MALFQILRFDPHFFTNVPDIVLRRRSVEINKFDDSLKQLGDEMLQILDELDGTGLAAPQIGVLQRVIALNVRRPVLKYSLKPPDSARAARLQPIRAILVNPEIVYRSPEEELEREDCFNMPGYFGVVKRACRVEVQARDMHGAKISLVADDLVARVIQHEIDHLDGILYVDRMEAGERLVPQAELDQETL